ncbi:hypothetical protein [Thermomonospora umbrina]|uniref:Secreted protein n=1 Tax=Thermomonospora umbrina TaxID=111806 RepID=A0A3D9SFR1_9ACTN|nr:hypothetical protein [Thermomonospora umbrina]REE94746.1 hypothetical protein DFJ69_0101 [Thermomonospora umbrina]
MLKKTLTVGAVSALCLGVAMASPASAVTAVTLCQTHVEKNYLTFVLPGKTDLHTSVIPCVHRDTSGNMRASIKFGWSAATLPAVGSGHKLDSLKVVVRMERRLNGSSNDTVLTYATCDFTDEVNSTWNGEETCSVGTAYDYDSSYDWSADGYFTYNFNNDGEGTFTNSLVGSPLIY